MLTTILAAAIVLGVLIFVHELGHFVTAKLVDIEVPRFSIGFGPKIIGFRRGETEYVLSLLPLGGYVKMAGMEEMEPIEGGADKPGETAGTEPHLAPVGGGSKQGRGPRDFESKSIGARTLVISAGVLMNLLFAYVVFASIGMVWGVPAVPEPVVGNVVEELLPPGAAALADVPRGARIVSVGGETVDDFEDLRVVLSIVRAGPIEIQFVDAPPITVDLPGQDSLRQAVIASIEPILTSDAVLDSVEPDGPAGTAGLEAGDRIIGANGQPVSSWQEFSSAIERAPGREVELSVLRGEDTLSFAVVPEARTITDGHSVGRIGVTSQPPVLVVEREQLGPGPALVYGFTETWRWTVLTVDVLARIFTGRLSARNVGGPILITQISGEAARAGLEVLLNFMALLSVNLAILNLLPIPVLDGGHLVFLLVEAVRGRPVSMEQRIRLTKVGMVLIFALMAFALGNDIVRWIGF